MAIDGITPPKKTQNNPIDQTSFKQATNTSLYESTILFGKTSFADKAKKVFWQGWDKVQDLFHTFVEWVKWLFIGCPGEKNMKFIKGISSDPKEQAKKFDKKPDVRAAEIILSTLLDPKEVEILRKENKGKFGEFFKAVKKSGKSSDELKALLEGKTGGIFNALGAVFDLSMSSRHDIFYALSQWIGKHPNILVPGLNAVSKAVLASIGEEDKDKDGENIKALRCVFGSYLPKVATEFAENPDQFEDFFKALYKSKSIEALKGTAIAPDWGAEKDALETILKPGKLAIRQLRDNKFEEDEYANIEPVDVRALFYKEVIKSLDPKHVGEIAKIFGKYPFFSALLGKIQNLDSSALKKISKNLTESTKMLAKLREDYKNPPSN